MNNKRIVGILSIIVCNLVFPAIARGEEVLNQGGKNSSVGIDIVESPIRLTSVQAPTFGTYELTGGKQEFQATGDLVIQVEDTRTSALSSWGVQYEVSLFEMTSGTSSLTDQARIKVGVGELIIAGQSADSSFYHPQAVELAAEGTGYLFQTTTSETTDFIYTVPKDKIALSIPNTVGKGEYTAVQTVTLINVPNTP